MTVDGEIIDLSVVPDGPTGPPDQVDFTPFQEKWLNWASETNRYRHHRLLATEGHIPGLDAQTERAKEWQRCKIYGAKYFITTWCWIHETRDEELRHYPWYDPQLGGWIPALLFGFQCDLIDWFERRMKSEGTGRNGAGSKSRDMGFTWMFMLWITHGFLFKKPWIAHCLSRNEDVVDTIGDISSMLERSAAQLVEDRANMNLPGWMLPDGWNADYRKTRHITSPSSRNGIHGESTNTKAGRSQRASVIGVDEVNFIDQDRIKKIRAGLMSTSPHVLMWSSESIEEHELFQEWKASMVAKVPDALIELDYWLHPFHDLRWLRSMEEAYEDDPEAFAREVLRDPNRGFGGWMYPDSREMGTVDANLWLPKDHGHGYIYLGIDPGLDDETAVHWVLHDPVCGSDVVINSYETGNRESAEFIAAIIAGAHPDDHPEFHFSYKDEEVMQWVRSIPQPKMIFGDPYGFREHAGKDDSWYARMRLWWASHNPNLNPSTKKPAIYPIVANTKAFQGGDARSYQARRQSLSRWMRMKLLFADTPEVKWTLHCIQNSRWDVSDRPRSTVQKDAKHDKFSHRRSAMEYLATNMEVLDFMTSDTARDRTYRPGTRQKAAA